MEMDIKVIVKRYDDETNPEKGEDWFYLWLEGDTVDDLEEEFNEYLDRYAGQIDVNRSVLAIHLRKIEQTKSFRMQDYRFNNLMTVTLVEDN